MPSDFDAKANEFIAKLQANPSYIASRKASQNAIKAFLALCFQNSSAAPLTWRHQT